MAFAGLRKQINKANQYVTEKMGGAEGTKLDYEFTEMERKTDVTVELVEELQVKTKEFLQPNPTARAKMAAVKGISKLSGQAKTNTYPQAEGILGDTMLMYGKKLGDESIFGQALAEAGDSLKQVADIKYALDDNVKQNYLEPLHQLQTKDLKEVMHHRKKLQGRRLDFDCKRRRQAKGSAITDDEIRSAEEKFAESLHLAQVGMWNLLENDVEQISQLSAFAESLLDYHQQCVEIMKTLCENLLIKKEEAVNRPKMEFTPKTLADLNIEGVSGDIGYNGGRFTPDSYISSHSSQSYQPRTSHPLRTGALYSSQQNLSSHSRQNPHNNNNTNINTHATSHFPRGSKPYGSTSNLAILQQNLNGASLSVASRSSNVNNNHVNSNVDNWLNAWDHPPPVVPSAAAPVAAKRSQVVSSGAGWNNNLYKGTSAGLLPPPPPSLKPLPLRRANNDPWSASPLPSPMKSPARTPMPQAHCIALYDFDPENPGELGFKENDIITLINRVDDNWFEGSVNGRTGYFPQSYVQVKVPLP